MAGVSKYKQIERKYGKPMREILIDLFARLRSQRAVANELDVDQATVYTWLLKLQLEQRTSLVPVKGVEPEQA